MVHTELPEKHDEAQERCALWDEDQMEQPEGERGGWGEQQVREGPSRQGWS